MLEAYLECPGDVNWIQSRRVLAALFGLLLSCVNIAAPALDSLPSSKVLGPDPCPLGEVVCRICNDRTTGVNTTVPDSNEDGFEFFLANRVICPDQVDQFEVFPTSGILNPPDMSGVYTQFAPGEFAWLDTAQITLAINLIDESTGTFGNPIQLYQGALVIKNHFIITEPVPGSLPFRSRVVKTENYSAAVSGTLEWSPIVGSRAATGLLSGTLSPDAGCGYGGDSNLQVIIRIEFDGSTTISLDRSFIGGLNLCPGDCEVLGGTQCSGRAADRVLPEPFYGRPLPFEVLETTGTIRGQLLSSVPIDTLSGIDVEQATVNLVKQTGFVRTAKLPGETDQAYTAYLAEQDNRSPIRSVKLTLASGGAFSFTNIRLIDRVQTASGPVSTPIYYTLYVTNAESEEIVVGADPATTHFMNGSARNLKAQFNAGVSPVIEQNVLLDPGLPTTAKLFLARQLSAAPTQNNYTAPEAAVITFVQNLEDNPQSLTPELLEGIQRAIWAERVTRDSASYADQLLSLGLTGLGAFLADVYDQFVSFLLKGKSKVEKDMKQVGSQQSNLNGAEWKLDPNLAQEQAKLRNHLNALNTRQSEAQFIDDVLGNGIKTLLNALQGFLTSSGVVSADTAKTIKGSVEKASAIVLKAVKNGALNGFSRASVLNGGLLRAAKVLIPEIVIATKPLLMDSSVLPSYTKLTAPFLQRSANRLLSPVWNQNIPAQYRADRDKVIDTMRRQGDAASSAIAAAQLTLGLAEGASAVEGGANLIGTIPPLKWVKVIGKAAKATKFLANASAGLVPFREAFTSMPVFMVEGTYFAFGDTPPNRVDNPPQKLATQVNPLARGQTNQRLAAAVPMVGTSFSVLLGQLADNLNADDIGAALNLTGDDTTSGYAGALSALNLSVSLFLTQVNAAGYDSADLLDAWLDFRLQEAAVADRLTEIYLKVFKVQYPGPGAPEYLVARDAAVAAIAALQAKLAQLETDIADTNTAITGLPLLPAIVVTTATITSNATGNTDITVSPESFTLTAHVRNVSTVAVQNLAADLSIDSPLGPVSATPAAGSPISIGTLMADDGNDGSGPDETDLQWTVTYSGDLSMEIIFLSIDLLEDGDVPISFVTRAALNTLMVAATIGDQDSDLIPDNLEVANGLDPTRDDASEDLDGDGVSNYREVMDLGTNPQVADSDNDGLDDLEEIAGGVDGYVTDPRNADSDGDGITDNADGQPLDAGTAAIATAAELIGEPVVNLSHSSVTLSSSNRSATVSVQNAGAGTLTWTALSDNDAIVAVSPADPDLRNGTGVLRLSVPDSFDFTAVPGLTSRVHVIDLTGNTHDIQSISVTVGVVSAVIFANGFE